MQSYNKFFKFASVRVFFRKKIEFILLFYARRWLWMLAYGRHLGACFFLLAFFLSSFYLAFFLFFLPARVLFFFLLAFFFFLLAFIFFLPAHVLSFVLLSRVLSFLSSCSRSFFRPFISRFVLLEFIFLNKSPSKICIYQKFVVPLHSNLNTLVRD